MKTFRFISTIMLGAFLLLACGTARESRKKDKEPVQMAKIVDSFDEYGKGDAIRITDVSLEKNVLTLYVEYSGGCGDQKHTFELLGSSMIQKSLPPKRGVKLFHDNNGDDCRSLIQDTLKFDISPLAYTGGEIILQLEGWDTPVSYTATK